jgi:hypothetical protein
VNQYDAIVIGDIGYVQQCARPQKMMDK